MWLQIGRGLRDGIEARCRLRLAEASTVRTSLSMSFVSGCSSVGNVETEKMAAWSNGRITPEERYCGLNLQSTRLG